MKDARRTHRPWVQAAVRRIDAVNRRHWWDHNEHFHGWVLRRLPVGARTALDLGCGQGLLVSRLAQRIPDVAGVDRDPGMVAAATARTAGVPGVTIRESSFEEVGRAGTTYDVVTMVAVLHHLDLDPACAVLARLLDPGGRLLIVGLSRTASRPGIFPGRGCAGGCSFVTRSSGRLPAGSSRPSRCGRRTSTPGGCAGPPA